MVKDIAEYATWELVGELKKREGVKYVECPPHKDYAISSDTTAFKDTGPAVILIVID